MAEDARQAELSEANFRGVQAFREGRLSDAVAIWEELARAFKPSEDHWAPQLYENIGLAYHNMGWARPALLAFLRALDGEPAGRQQSARYAVTASLNRHHFEDARRLLRAYEARFGTHPDWTEEAIADLESDGSF